MVHMQVRRGQRIDSIEASAYTIPTDLPEADGTLSWTSTTLIVVESRSGDIRGVGYSYTHQAAAMLVHPCCATSAVRHLEWFHDHVRIERMLFDGVLSPVGGELVPDLSQPGIGLEFKRTDAARYAVTV